MDHLIPAFAEGLSGLLKSEVLRHIVEIGFGILVLPAIAWCATQGKRLAAVHRTLLPSKETSLADVVRNILVELLVLKNGIRHCISNQDALTFESDGAGRWIWASPTLASVLGISQEDLQGVGWLAAVDGAEARENVWRTWVTTIEQGIPYRASFFVRNVRSADRFLMEVVASATPDTGKPVHFWGNCRKVAPVKVLVDDEVAMIIDRKPVNER